jgi:hypothetical protein
MLFDQVEAARELVFTTLQNELVNAFGSYDRRSKIRCGSLPPRCRPGSEWSCRLQRRRQRSYLLRINTEQELPPQRHDASAGRNVQWPWFTVSTWVRNSDHYEARWGCFTGNELPISAGTLRNELREQSIRGFLSSGFLQQAAPRCRRSKHPNPRSISASWVLGSRSRLYPR